MRPELELIETIEKYLKGEMNAAEKTEFEKRLQNDSKLQKEVKLQQDIMNGIERTAMKQKITKAYTKYMSGKNFLKWGSLGTGIIAVSTAVLFYTTNHKASSNSYMQRLPDLNEQGTKQWSDADKYLPGQIFSLNTNQDTVIQTRGGMVLAVPANCFLDENGNPVTGPIDLEVKEALDPASMMKAGLSTKSGGNLLETAGMFYINSRKDGKSLRINPNNGIYVHVPSDTVKSGMQVFQGKRMPNGTIDWMNPKPLVHNLVPVNIHTLNFYPPLYLDSLAYWGKDVKNKKYTDSLYYSFAGLFGGRGQGGRQQQALRSDTTIYVHYYSKDTVASLLCGINPAKIKAIWSDEFQNTIISTREFEARMPYIHKTENEAILDLYVNNLDKNLSYIDSLAARQLYGDLKTVFLSFAARGDGKIAVKSKMMEKLKVYYDNKSRLFTEATIKAQQAFGEKQYKLDSIAMVKSDTDANREYKMMGKEYEINLKEACRQVGDPDSVGIPEGSGYAVLVNATGWNNIDQFVWESTRERTTLDYTSPRNGKKAIIRYLPFSVSINNYKNYDNVFVYLLPNKLNSFMRLEDTNGVFRERLDELFAYKMECVAYKGKHVYYYSMDDVGAKAYTIDLQEISMNELNNKLGGLGNQSQKDDMAKEVDYMQFQMQDKRRTKKNEEREALTEKFEKLIFPCYGESQQQGGGRQMPDTYK